MGDTVDSRPLHEQLRSDHTEKLNALAAFAEERKSAREAFTKRENSEDAKPTDDERSAFVVAEEEHQKEFDRREADLKSLKRRIAEETVIEERRSEAANAARSSVNVSITHQPLTYRKDNADKISYVRDLASRYHATFASRYADTQGAHERLESHGKEMNDELVKRAKKRERDAERRIEQAEREFTGSLQGAARRRGFDASPFEQRVNPNRTDGQGGYLVPPLWLIDDYIPYLRAGRVAADLCRNMPLPEGTDSINIPKIASGTATAMQTADNAAVQSTDFTDTSVSAGVKTLAGQQDVAIQLIEQSPGQIVDQVVMEDLLADYNQKLDAQVLTGTGSSGQVLGILPASNYTNSNTITWTPSYGGTPAPTAIAFNQAVGAAVSKTAYTRYNLSNLNVLVHPRRWFWFATSLDNTTGAGVLTGRPLVNTTETGYNLAAIENNPAPYQGLVGRFPFGPSAYIDANVPAVASTGGAITGGTADLGVVAKWDDIWLFEGDLRTRVLPEVLSGTLQIRFQVFGYVALLVRYGQSIAVIQGTGMAAPTGLDTSIVY